MGKYDKYKKLVLAANLIKNTVTTSLPGFPGQLTTAGPGNEGVEMVEWINERIDDGSIVTIPPIAATNLNFVRDGVSVTVTSDTGTDAVLPASTTSLAGIMTASDKIIANSLITLSGVPTASTNLGTFTGSIIPDNITIKAAFQSLETAIQSLPTVTSGDLTSSTTAISITGGTSSVLGAGTQLVFNPANVNLSTLGGTLNVNQISTTGATVNEVIIFDGTSWTVNSIPVVPVDHIDLLNLQGGITGEYYHLSESVYDKLITTNIDKILGRVSTVGEIQELSLGGSLVFNGTSIELAGDNVTPGNNKYWGTNASGVKGFYTLSAVGTVTNVAANDSVDIDFTVTNPTTTPDITAILTNTGVTAGTYGSSSSVGQFIVNSKGRITGAGTIPISITSSAITDFSESVDDRLNSLLVAGTGITLTYDDTANTLTVASTATGVAGTGVANRVAFWTNPTTLSNDSDLGFDGTYLTLGNPSSSIAKFTSKGVGASIATFGYIHQNAAGSEVFKVADNGAISIGAFGEVFIHPDSINLSTGGTFPIQVSGGDLSLYSDQTVVVEGGGSSTNLPSFKSVATRSTAIGNLYNAQIMGNVEMTIGGTNSFTDLLIDTRVNQTLHTGFIRSLHIKPVVTASNNYIGAEIDVPSTETALKITSGEIRFELPSSNTGDLFYRDSTGKIVNLGIGSASEVLGSTGTIPAWTTTAGSLPGGTNGDFLIYSGGSWISGTLQKEKISGITGTGFNLGVTPLTGMVFILYRNGVYQDDTDDYSIMGNSITMTMPLISSDKITAIYYI